MGHHYIAMTTFAMLTTPQTSAQAIKSCYLYQPCTIQIICKTHLSQLSDIQDIYHQLQVMHNPLIWFSKIISGRPFNMIDSESNQAFIEFIDDPCPDVQIAVVEGVMRESGFSSHAAYVIKVSRPVPITAERRYREFAALRQVMLSRWPGVYIPSLPSKHISGNSDLKVVSERIKYLTYFLNCIAKIDYLFMSEQFQLFLNSNSSDLKKLFEKMEKPTYESIVERYQRVFPQIKPILEQKTELMNKIKDEVLPFAKELQGTETLLVNTKKQLYKLAIKREEYLRSLGDLYSEALPNFEKYIGSTCEQAPLVLLGDPVLRQKIAEAKVSRAISYWIIYEAVRLQIAETKAVLEVIHCRTDIEREQERIRQKIASNQEQLNNIRLKKSTLRQFFSKNTDELTRQLEKENEFLRRQLTSVEIAIIYVNELILRHLIWDFKEKRYKIWRRACKYLVTGERELNLILADFFRMIAVI